MAGDKTYSTQELRETLVDNSLHDTPVHVSKPDAHHRTNNEENEKEVHVLSFSASVRWDHIFEQLFDALEEDIIDVSSSFL